MKEIQSKQKEPQNFKTIKKKIAKLLNIEIDIIDGDDRESKTIEMEKKYHI